MKHTNGFRHLFLFASVLTAGFTTRNVMAVTLNPVQKIDVQKLQIVATATNTPTPTPALLKFKEPIKGIEAIAGQTATVTPTASLTISPSQTVSETPTAKITAEPTEENETASPTGTTAPTATSASSPLTPKDMITYGLLGLIVIVLLAQSILPKKQQNGSKKPEQPNA